MRGTLEFVACWSEMWVAWRLPNMTLASEVRVVLLEEVALNLWSLD